ncbi:MAG: flagellar protein FlaG [Syntrophaceae bacterium]
MKIESASAVSLEQPVRSENTGVGSGSISPISTKRGNAVEPSSQKSLQNETRSTEEIQKDVDAINQQLKTADSSLQFSVDDTSNEVVVRIVERDSGKVIRQIPPESIVRLRENMREMSGLFVEEKI